MNLFIVTVFGIASYVSVAMEKITLPGTEFLHINWEDKEKSQALKNVNERRSHVQRERERDNIDDLESLQDIDDVYDVGGRMVPERVEDTNEYSHVLGSKKHMLWNTNVALRGDRDIPLSRSKLAKIIANTMVSTDVADDIYDEDNTEPEPEDEYNTEPENDEPQRDHKDKIDQDNTVPEIEEIGSDIEEVSPQDIEKGFFSQPEDVESNMDEVVHKTRGQGYMPSIDDEWITSKKRKETTDNSVPEIEEIGSDIEEMKETDLPVSNMFTYVNEGLPAFQQNKENILEELADNDDDNDDVDDVIGDKRHNIPRHKCTGTYTSIVLNKMKRKLISTKKKRKLDYNTIQKKKKYWRKRINEIIDCLQGKI